jgi:hypothetical protein
VIWDFTMQVFDHGAAWEIIWNVAYHFVREHWEQRHLMNENIYFVKVKPVGL